MQNYAIHKQNERSDCIFFYHEKDVSNHSAVAVEYQSSRYDPLSSILMKSFLIISCTFRFYVLLSAAEFRQANLC